MPNDIFQQVSEPGCREIARIIRAHSVGPKDLWAIMTRLTHAFWWSVFPLHDLTDNDACLAFLRGGHGGFELGLEAVAKNQHVWIGILNLNLDGTVYKIALMAVAPDENTLIETVKREAPKPKI